MRFGVLISSLTALALMGLAHAADSALAPFAGQWVGKVTVETQGLTDFPNSVRDVGVAVVEDAAGFKIEWSTVRRESGVPQNPDETATDTNVDFVAAGEGRWAAAGGDPAAGKPIWFARVDSGTLIISGFAMTSDGKAELQTYSRTIEDGTMGIVYTRVVDGAVVRRASGTLTKFAQ